MANKEPVTQDSVKNDNVSSDKETMEEHSLQHVWTLHYDSGYVKGQEWGASIKPVANLTTVEEFWRLYNNIIRPSDLSGRYPQELACTYSLFKKGVKPMYEDEVNKNGGVWTLQFGTREDNDGCRSWLFTLLALIGEQFTVYDEICGATIANKKFGLRITLWTKNHDNEQLVSIGEQWLDALNLTRAKITYAKHGSKTALHTVKGSNYQGK